MDGRNATSATITHTSKITAATTTARFTALGSTLRAGRDRYRHDRYHRYLRLRLRLRITVRRIILRGRRMLLPCKQDNDSHNRN
jgi:hypothetical protein